MFMSGTTGDTSSIKITNIRPNSLATQSSKGLGMTGDASKYTVDQSKVDALRGIESLPAVLTGNALGVNVDNNFSVDETNNKFVVSVNGVTGTVVVPPKDTYTLGTFMEAACLHLRSGSLLVTDDFALDVAPGEEGAGKTLVPVRPGETVVVAGQQRLQRDGSPVRVIDVPRGPGGPGGVGSAGGPGAQAAAGAPGGARFLRRRRV